MLRPQVLSLLLLGALAGAATAQSLVVPPTAYPALGSTRGMAVGDFDGDGRPDVALALFLQASVSVLTGTGTGFDPAVTFAVAARPIRVATGDLDGDGHLDLVTVHASASANVSVLIGNGDGTFAPFLAGPSVPETPSAVALADLDGDGFDDLLVGAGPVSVHIFPGLGDGTFGPPTTVTFNGVVTDEGGVREFAVGDLDNDGDLDIVAAVFDFGTRVIMNHGGFTFTQHTQPSWWGYQTWGVDLADVDQDGTLDLYWIEGDGFETGGEVRQGKGDGTFAAPEATALFFDVAFARFAELNGDGDPDFVGAITAFGGQARLSWSFGAPGVAAQGGQNAFFFARCEALETADLDGDGFDEVMVSDSQGQRLLVFWNVGCPGPGTVFGVTPAAVPAVAWPASELVLTGCDLDAVTAVTLGGVATTFAVDVAGKQLEASVPQGLPLGPAAITWFGAAGPLGSESVDIVASSAPVLALVPGTDLSTSGVAALVVGAAPTDLAFVFLSPELVGSSLPGVLDLAIGNGFTSLFLLATPTVGPNASVALGLPIAGAPVGVTVHFQAAVLEAANPVLPLVPTNVASATIVP